ncbi:MAG: DUF4923 family protein [Bacteroidales bacterium]|nr:DUF4923 family protein [Bacteroidales bacterium]
MKRIVLVFCALFFSLAPLKAQGVVNAIKNIASDVGDAFAGKKVKITGEWKYKGVGAGFEGGNIVSDVTTSATMIPLEKKVDEYLAKVGLKPGVATFVFNEDGTYKVSSDSFSIRGNWTLEDGIITMSIGKTISFITLRGTLKKTVDGVEILFPADKFLSFVEKVGGIYGVLNENAKLEAIFALLDKKEGVMLGWRLVK